MIHYMLLLGYILVTCHKNNIVTLHVTFMLWYIVAMKRVYWEGFSNERK